jgi:hypothetical protein
VSYADIEELYINGSIALCDKYPFYHFSVECVAVLDKFLQRNPHMEEKIRQVFSTIDNLVNEEELERENIINETMSALSITESEEINSDNDVELI